MNSEDGGGDFMCDNMEEYSELLKKYEALIWMHALRWHRKNPSVDLEDLVQVGRLALWTAMNRHDGRDGFVHFFCTVMNREMLAWVAWARSTIRTPGSALKRKGWLSGLHIVSIDEAVSAEGRPLAEMVAVREDRDDLSDREGLLDWLHGAMEDLSEEERRVLKGRFLEGKGLKELGHEIGASHQWASKLEQRALARLRRASRILDVA